MKKTKQKAISKTNIVDLFFINNSKIFALTALLFILTFLVFTPLSGDDVDYFAHQTANFDWLSLRYNTWSSRIVIESFLPFMAKHEWIFKIITIAMFLSSPVVIYLLAQKYRINPTLCVLVIAIFPFYKLTTAGYAATMTNYFYPILLGLWVFVYIYVRKPNLIGYLILTVFCIIAGNHEQTAILMLLLSIPALFIKDTDKVMAAITLVASLIGLYFIFTCPGNAVRVIAETKTWLEGYENYTLVDKINLGITSALYFLNFRGPVAFLFCLAAVTLVVSKRLSVSLALVVLFTLVVNLLLKKYIGSKVLVTDANWLFNFPISSFVILFAMPLLMVILVFFMNISTFDKVAIIGIIALAYAIRCSMGFSPTVFASIERPSMFSHLLFILCGLYALLKGNADRRKVYTLITLFGMYGATNSLLRALRSIHHALV